MVKFRPSYRFICCV